MKKMLSLILFFSCSKENQRVSDEVLLTVTSECHCYIKVFETDGSQYLSTTFDCQYVRILPLHITSGTYTVKAENAQGKQINQPFTKGHYSQTLNIEF